MDNPTDKQITKLNKIIDYLGQETVKNYFKKFYPNGDFSNMTRKQVQKLITGLGNKLPSKPISSYGFYG